jgi:membrane-associated phospholipid phosphatase
VLLHVLSPFFKKAPVALIAISALFIPSGATAQTSVPDQNPPVAASPAETPAPETATVSAASDLPVAERQVSWKLLYHNVLADQKRIWTFPVRLMHGQNWIPTLAVVGTTAGLVFADRSEAAYFRNTTAFHGFRNIFTGNATAIGIGAAPASLYAIGLLRKDSKMQHTALLAGEALADTAIVQTVLKDIARRVKPTRYPAYGWFASQGPPSSYIRGNGSFPSGHSMAAFSVATVIARRYGNHRWVPYAAYGLATVVGFSRLTLNVHFLSDICMGGAIGYSISRFTVLRQ